MKSKYKTTLFIISFLATVGILTLVHYKLWTMANENEYLAVNTSGCVDIIYSDDQDIMMVNPKALSDEDGIATIPNTITVTNNCSSKENISLYFDTFNDSTISDNKLKVNINGDYKLDTSLLSDVNKIIGKGNILNTYKLLSMELSSRETKRINFRIWLEHNVALSPEKNIFHAKYYILSDKEDKKQNFMEVLLKNNKIVENNGLIKYNKNYYFNGSLNNNNVSFADMAWKILGINDDGTIKLIYNGDELQSAYSERSTDEKNVAFDDSKIKTLLDSFYEEKLKEFDKYISTKEYCNDTSSTNTYYRIYYGSYTRNYNDFAPSNECPKTDKEYGGLKQYKIGLITLDEAAIAGLTTDTNDTNYLFNGKDYYTMSPTQYNYRALVGIVDRYGRLNDTYVTDTKSVRPVINLINSLEVSGDGSEATPYLVKLN